MSFVSLGGDGSARPTFFEMVAADRLMGSLKAATMYSFSVMKSPPAPPPPRPFPGTTLRPSGRCRYRALVWRLPCACHLSLLALLSPASKRGRAAVACSNWALRPPCCTPDRTTSCTAG